MWNPKPISRIISICDVVRVSVRSTGWDSPGTDATVDENSVVVVEGFEDGG